MVSKEGKIMTQEEIRTTCELLYSTHFIPVAVIEGEDVELNCSYEGYREVFRVLSKSANEDKISLINGTVGLYGAVKVKDTDILVMAGPYINKRTDDAVFDELIHRYGMDWQEKENIKEFLHALPHYSLNTFLNFLVLLHYLFNGERLSILDFFKEAQPAIQQKMGENSVKDVWEENDVSHGTYRLEMQIYRYVSEGDLTGLEAFFDKIARAEPIKEGKLADDALRQSKNIFIGLITMVGKVGAIRGNLDIEQTFNLIDLYTQECERCTSVSQINQLRYTAILDFTRRVAELKHPDAYSGEVFRALQFIKSHTNRPIGVQDVLDEVKKSRSVFMEQFKKETGETIGQYITKAKLEEAKLLLAYSDKSLPAISNTLYFSSQSYFQNLFKKQYGLTPLEYRKQHHKG